MSDRAGAFAGCADTFTYMCAYYVAAGILIMSRRGWGLHLFWLLLCAAACTLIFTLLLKKPRSVPFLTAVTGALFLAEMGVFWLASETPMRFGYGFVLAVGAGMAVGLPLQYALHRPLIHRHLALLDLLILVLLVLLLTREALGIDGATVALMTAVLLMDAASAVGLRMSDGGDGTGAFRASMVALAAAAALALVIALLALLFSKSGGVTDSVLRGIGAFFSAVGRGIERFFGWLMSFVRVKEETAPLELEEMPSLAGLSSETIQGGPQPGGGVITAVLAVLIAAAAVAAAVILRKKRVARAAAGNVSPSAHAVRRTGGTARAVWQRILARLRFAWTAFVRRHTPGGVLVILERRGRRARKPRGTGETMRQYIRRMDPAGGLDSLADALDRVYYGGETDAMSARQCRELIRYIRKAV